MSWSLESAEERAAEAPRTFFIPPAEVRRGLKPGDLVKLTFRLEREDGEVAVERMWVDVTALLPGGRYGGTLANEPQLTGVIAYGASVEFGPEHVAPYEYPPGHFAYDVDARCWVSKRVAAREEPPAWLYRDREGGWHAFSGEESREEYGNAEHVLAWTLGYLTDRWPETEAVLGEDARDAWWHRDGDAYVRQPAG